MVSPELVLVDPTLLGETRDHASGPGGDTTPEEHMSGETFHVNGSNGASPAPAPSPTADQQSAPSLETVLFKAGLITADQLGEVVLERVQSGRPAGDIVVERGLVSREALAEMLVSPSEPAPAPAVELVAAPVLDHVPAPAAEPVPVPAAAPVEPSQAPAAEPVPAPAVEPAPIAAEAGAAEPVPAPVAEAFAAPPPAPVVEAPVAEPAAQPLPAATAEAVQHIAPPAEAPALAEVAEPVAAAAPAVPVAEAPPAAPVAEVQAEPVAPADSAPAPENHAPENTAPEQPEPVAVPDGNGFSMGEVHYGIRIRLAEGVTLDAGSYPSRERAVEAARGIANRLAAEGGEWPLVGDTLVRPEAVLAIEIDSAVSWFASRQA